MKYLNENESFGREVLKLESNANENKAHWFWMEFWNGKVLSFF